MIEWKEKDLKFTEQILSHNLILLKANHSYSNVLPKKPNILST